MLAAHFGDPDKAFPGAGETVSDIDVLTICAESRVEAIDCA